MQNSNRHNRILNRLLAGLLSPFLRWIFGFSHQKQKLSGPSLVISNHVTNFDPLLVSICFPRDHMHFVASEHLFRLGWITKFLRYVFDPIPRRKGTSGADTALACMRALRNGRNVCLFAEGECSWDGITANIFPATGRLAQMSGANLVTFRLEGGYLTAPRWGKGIRQGKMTGRVVGIYTAEDLKNMDKDAITALIQRDISENAWESQACAPIRYRNRRRAENLQTVLYGCPRCQSIGNLSSRGKTLSCRCGAAWEYTEFGVFSPAQPYETIAQWDAWQRSLLHDVPRLQFSDPDVTLYAVEPDHRHAILAQGALLLKNGALHCGEYRFALADIDDMALVQSRTLLLSVGRNYYQFKSKKPSCLRKYHAAWCQAAAESKAAAGL